MTKPDEQEGHAVPTWVNGSVGEANQDGHAEGEHNGWEQLHAETEPLNGGKAAEEGAGKAVEQIEIPLHEPLLLAKASDGSCSRNGLSKQVNNGGFLDADNAHKLPRWSHVVLLHKA